jgi:hypothetical protein
MRGLRMIFSVLRRLVFRLSPLVWWGLGRVRLRRCRFCFCEQLEAQVVAAFGPFVVLFG